MDVRFKKLAEDDLEMVLRWRTKPEITHWLFTDIPFDMDKQREWFKELEADTNRMYWIARINGRSAGSFFLNGDELGFFLGTNEFKGLAPIFLAMFYSWWFDHGREKFIIHIFSDHERLKQVHYSHGYRILEINSNYAKGRTVCKMELDKKSFSGPKILPAEVEI
jgi:UDP-4-amino-4,6-dideoxy-N-acetyl-beta-L-altrosamine N-acetyltransferase